MLFYDTKLVSTENIEISERQKILIKSKESITFIVYRT